MMHHVASRCTEIFVFPSPNHQSTLSMLAMHAFGLQHELISFQIRNVIVTSSTETYSLDLLLRTRFWFGGK